MFTQFKSIFLLVIFFSLFSLIGCTRVMLSSSFNPALLGQWKFKDSSLGPHVLTFTRDFEFSLDYNGDGQKDIWGKYQVFKNRLKFVEPRGETETICKHPGFHLFAIKKNELNIKEFADACKPRKLTLQYPLIKVAE